MNTVWIDSGNVKMIAHRGLSGIEKENTNTAFVAAANRSYFGIETDVHVTKDGKFVIIHDETTNRITGGKHNLNVEENDYSAVENIILPDLDGTTARKDIKIPLLEEYIRICKKYGKVCVLEVKNRFAKNDLKNLIDEITALSYLDKVIFISFDLENCLNLRDRLPENGIQWLAMGVRENDSVIETLCKHRIDIDIYYKSLNAGLVGFLHSKGIKINCWTCDDKNEEEELVKLGVDFITTDILE